MKKILLLLPAFCFFILTLTACGKDDSKAAYPSYIIMSGTDNGFVAASRAYFSVDDKEISKITEKRYEKLLYADKPEYEIVMLGSYTFDVTANESDPGKWDYTEQKYGDDPYDTDSVIKDLKMMGEEFTGNGYVLVNVFDDYRIVEFDLYEGDRITEKHFGLFIKDEMIMLPEGMKLDQLRKIHRLKE